MNDLIGALTSQLGIDTRQAEGAAGAIFGAIKSEASGPDFAALAAKVPEASGWMKSAEGLLPAGGGGAASGVAGAIGGLLGGAGGGLGSLASLLPMLQKLDLNKDVLGQLAPIVTSFIQQRAGTEIMGKLTQGSPLLGQLASMAGGGGAGAVGGIIGKLF